jgi:hypothetical protein
MMIGGLTIKCVSKYYIYIYIYKLIFIKAIDINIFTGLK